MKRFHFRTFVAAAMTYGLFMGQVRADTGTFTFPSLMGFNNGTPPVKVSPYPASLAVSGLSGTVHKVTVQLTGLSHFAPDSIDLLLVAPGGAQAVILSDVGGNSPINAVTLVLDDAAANHLPEASAFTSGTYKPTNLLSPDSFPAPAPPAVGNSALSAFSNINPNGTWNLYMVSDAASNIGTLQSWSLTISTVKPAEPGQLVISEFRLRGPQGVADEFVEIQNATDEDHIVTSVDGSAGYALAASDGIARFVIPNDTVIPARGHFLGVNSGGYSLSSHPAGSGTTATGDLTYTTNIEDNAGIALFRTASALNFNQANRLDSAGSTAEANSLYKEGTGYPAISPFTIDYSFFRGLASGVSKDTGVNAHDFVFVETNGASAGAGQRLGAPGPESLFSPIRLRTSNMGLIRGLPSPAHGFNFSPNRLRYPGSDPVNQSTFGTLEFRRKFTNITNSPLTRLRFRIVDLSTFPSPAGIADLRSRTSGDVVESVVGVGNLTMLGTTLEQPAHQPNGGGINSVMSVNAVTPATPLVSGSSINARFVFGVQQTGKYRIALIPEMLPAAPAAVWIIQGHTDTNTADQEDLQVAPLTLQKTASNVSITYTCPPGLKYQLQYSNDLIGWGSLGPVFYGPGTPLSYQHVGGGTPRVRFYRVTDVP